MLSSTAEVPEPEAEIRHGAKNVGRVTSAAPGVVALAYVSTEVPEDAELSIGSATARLH